jgi:hypothetical protein
MCAIVAFELHLASDVYQVYQPPGYRVICPRPYGNALVLPIAACQE